MKQRSAFANFPLNAFTIRCLTWLAEKIGWIPSESYENADTRMPSFLKRTLVQPIVNPEPSTLLHSHTKFVFV